MALWWESQLHMADGEITSSDLIKNWLDPNLDLSSNYVKLLYAKGNKLS